MAFIRRQARKVVYHVIGRQRLQCLMYPLGAATAVDNVHWRGMENCSSEQKYKHEDICAQGWLAFAVLDPQPRSVSL